MDFEKVSTHPLQTKAWADFRKAWGNEVLETKYGILTIHHLPFTSWKIGMFIRGPKPSAQMLTDLKQIALKNNLIFIKLEPDCLKSNFQFSIFKDFDIRPGKTLFTPTSYWIDLTKSEEELLKGFKSKTRYNIRYAQKIGVKVVEDNSEKAFNTYIKLMRETVHRQRFYAHTEKYHRLMWKFLHKAGIANLLVAKYKNKIPTAWVLFKWKDRLYYPYGASTHEQKNIQASSAMMWAAIQFGKQHRLKTFDLWGREEGKGFAHFKEGFNPEIVEFLGTWDLVINKNLYSLYLVLEKARWLILRTKSKFVKPSF